MPKGDETYCPICHDPVRGLHFHMAVEVLARRAAKLANKET